MLARLIGIGATLIIATTAWAANDACEAQKVELATTLSVYEQYGGVILQSRNALEQEVAKLRARVTRLEAEVNAERAKIKERP